MTFLTTTKGQRDLPRWFSSAFALLSKMRVGRVEIGLPDGRVFARDCAEPGPVGRIDVRDPAMFGRVVRDGDIGFAEAYMDGQWDTPDLQALLDVFVLNNDEIGQEVLGMALVRYWERVNHWFRSNSKEQARKNISYHYDLGNDFYGLWLDDTMSYSSALFAEGENSLEAAQIAKYASMCDEIGVKPGDHILEIGCGWGGFAEYAAKERGARVTGLTISQEQHDYAVERMKRAGVADQVQIVMRDYRDETGTYDAIASIEMFEAVGEKYWPTYFDAVRERLKPGGRGTFQIITVDDPLFANYRKNVDFIQKYIFPGGMLPSVTALREQISRAGLTEVNNIAFGQSYSETLRRWHATFNARWDEVAALGFDDRFRRMWNFYLTSCAATFMTGTTDVIQMTVRR
ncbi:SAM-dependent methyltransferase [Pontivivens insulae]|uniref:Tuberculostearic acid methyltransferase UfaA1 n=1 Tax=Pontivivens insulae TaxID=1639689 RepID=A0A2R8AD26_9RHOB|nr:cyclopropane-fatty-acyl-phospholipid synthase family protein [Pontivivens insulae]RED13988.1 cyclopropane-fatty-acyl-phospholipid synthase [Pontivivens insulae]SPF30062.1 Tuberculostearic acid methyltransferase UfaA1 [Pontivivens insulae]